MTNPKGMGKTILGQGHARQFLLDKKASNGYRGQGVGWRQALQNCQVQPERQGPGLVPSA